jgi:hypothetical protein
VSDVYYGDEDSDNITLWRGRFLDTQEQVVNVDVEDSELSSKSQTLGYLNTHSDKFKAVYCVRCPARAWKAGLTRDNTGFVARGSDGDFIRLNGSEFSSTNFGAMLTGSYPSFKEALSFCVGKALEHDCTVSRAFHLTMALESDSLGYVKLYYKGTYCGRVIDGTIELATKYWRFAYRLQQTGLTVEPMEKSND